MINGNLAALPLEEFMGTNSASLVLVLFVFLVLLLVFAWEFTDSVSGKYKLVKRPGGSHEGVGRKKRLVAEASRMQTPTAQWESSPSAQYGLKTLPSPQGQRKDPRPLREKAAFPALTELAKRGLLAPETWHCKRAQITFKASIDVPMFGTVIEQNGDGLVEEAHISVGWPLHIDGAVRQ